MTTELHRRMFVAIAEYEHRLTRYLGKMAPRRWTRAGGCANIEFILARARRVNFVVCRRRKAS